MPGYAAMSRDSFLQRHVDDPRNVSAHASRPSRRISVISDVGRSSTRQSSIRERDEADASGVTMSFIDVGKKALLLNSGFLDRDSVSQQPDNRATYSPPSAKLVPVWIQIL